MRNRATAALLALVGHAQFFALTGDAAAHLGPTYALAAQNLAWINFRYDITGLYGSSSQTAGGLYSSTTAVGAAQAGSRRLLQGQEQVATQPGGGCRKLLQGSGRGGGGGGGTAGGGRSVTPAEAKSYNTLVSDGGLWSGATRHMAIACLRTYVELVHMPVTVDSSRLNLGHRVLPCEPMARCSGGGHGRGVWGAANARPAAGRVAGGASPAPHAPAAPHRLPQVSAPSGAVNCIGSHSKP